MVNGKLNAKNGWADQIGIIFGLTEMLRFAQHVEIKWIGNWLLSLRELEIFRSTALGSE